MLWFVYVVLTIILIGGLARLLLAFRRSTAFAKAGHSVEKQNLLTLGLANIIGSVFGLFCVLTRALEPLQALIGVLLATSLLEVVIRSASSKTKPPTVAVPPSDPDQHGTVK